MSAPALKFCKQPGAVLKTDVTRLLTGILAFCLLLPAGMAGAEPISTTSNARMLALQTRVDRLYEGGNFERAFLIYRDELAAAGDKYAQYMVGYMTLAGQGVKQDPVVASAWYRLAAEQGTIELEGVRDELLSKLNDAQIQQSDAVYLKLRRQYSDAALLLDLIRKDLKALTVTVTGSRLGATSGPLTVIDQRTGMQISGDDYFRAIRQRLGVRLKTLRKVTSNDDIDVDVDNVDINLLERQVDEHLRTLP